MVLAAYPGSTAEYTRLNSSKDVLAAVAQAEARTTGENQAGGRR